MNYNRTGGHVLLKSHAVAALNSALYLSCPAGTTISSTPTPRHTRRCAHPHTVDVCVHVQRPVRRSSASPMPLYGCMTHRPACPTRVDFHSWISLLKHVLHPPSPPPPTPLASIASCHVLCLRRAALHLTYTVHARMHQTPAYLKEPVLFLHLRHRI